MLVMMMMMVMMVSQGWMLMAEKSILRGEQVLHAQSRVKDNRNIF